MSKHFLFLVEIIKALYLWPNRIAFLLTNTLSLFIVRTNPKKTDLIKLFFGGNLLKNVLIQQSDSFVKITQEKPLSKTTKKSNR